MALNNLYYEKHGPPDESGPVMCHVCGLVFCSSLIRLDAVTGRFVGACAPECSGHGYNRDFYDEDDRRFDIPLPGEF